MTRIVIAAFGTRGDVVPVAGLGVRLRSTLGAEVTVAAQQPYEPMITAAGLQFALLPKDTEQATRESTYGQGVVDGARMRPSTEVMAQMRDDLVGVGEAMAAAATGCDLLLLEGPIGGLLGYHVAEALGIPSMGLLLQPASATGQFAPPALTARSFGRWGNRLAWRAGEAGESVYTPLVDDLRRSLGLPHESRRSYQRRRNDLWPVLYGFSAHVVPRPPDWRAGLDVTGYWWSPDAPARQPSPELSEFLRAGPPPVFVGLGSTATARGEQLSRTIVAALRQAGARAVVQAGWARLHADGDDVITVGDLPHQWLFPRMAAVIHHAGAGTSAAVLRAGVPSVPVTGIMDQPFWARRLHALGVATAPLRRVSLTAEELAAAVTDAVGDPRYRQRAQELSPLIEAEDGAAKAIDVIRTKFGLTARH